MALLSNVMSGPRKRLARWSASLLPEVVASADMPGDDGQPLWQPDEPDEYCSRCGMGCGPGAALAQGCHLCVNKTLAWDRIVRLGTYHEQLNEWILEMKFARRWTWARWIGRQLAVRLGPMPTHGRVGLCSVPMHLWRRWGRGFNQSDLIARTIAQELDWPLLPVLRRSRYTVPQSTVSAQRRLTNVHESFERIPMDLTGWEIWLVDDVKTTGATLTACAKLLREAGATRIHVAVAAVADPKSETEFLQ